jgi:ATP-dependent Clp protease adapter protein ClpS
METSGSFGTTRKRRKRLHLYLINDNYNTMDHVIDSIQHVLPLCNVLTAEQIAVTSHAAGEAEMYSGFGNDVYIKYAQLQKLGLTVDIKL